MWKTLVMLLLMGGTLRAGMQYHFQPGQKVYYAIKIEMETPEYLETLTGISRYEVKSVVSGSGQMTLIHSADLVDQVRSNPKDNKQHAFPSFRNPSYNDRREIVIDGLGRIVRNQG